MTAGPSNQTLRSAIPAIAAIEDPTIAAIATIAARFTAKAEPKAKMEELGDDQIEYEERAAILEFDGGLSRAEAERGARLEMQARERNSLIAEQKVCIA